MRLQPRLQSQIILPHSPLTGIASLIYHITSCGIQYFGTCRIVYFLGTILVKESILVHLFAVDYDVVWIVNARRRFPLAGQNSYRWQKPDWSNHWDLLRVVAPRLKLPNLSCRLDVVPLREYVSISRPLSLLAGIRAVHDGHVQVKQDEAGVSLFSSRR